MIWNMTLTDVMAGIGGGFWIVALLHLFERG